MRTFYYIVTKVFSYKFIILKLKCIKKIFSYKKINILNILRKLI